MRFKPFYARWWDVSPNVPYLFQGWSQSGASAWLWMDGERRCVPVACLQGGIVAHMNRNLSQWQPQPI